MSTTKPFLGVNLPPEIIERIDDFRFLNRFKSRAAAVEYILRAGMKTLADEYPELDLTVYSTVSKKSTTPELNEGKIHNRETV